MSNCVDWSRKEWTCSNVHQQRCIVLEIAQAETAYGVDNLLGALLKFLGGFFGGGVGTCLGECSVSVHVAEYRCAKGKAGVADAGECGAACHPARRPRLTDVNLALLDDNGRAVNLVDDVVNLFWLVGIRAELIAGKDVVEK